MRIAVVHDWEPDLGQEMTWKDGLAAAVSILSQRHEVAFYTLGKVDCILPHDYFPIMVCRSSEKLKSEVLLFKPDVILMWGDCTRPNAGPLAELGIPMALCFAGGDTQGHTAVHFQHFFVESQVYKERFEAAGKSVSIAFGTNTELFQPLPDQQKYFDVIFPATYCDWKRHELFTKATQGLRTVTAGFMYPISERYCWEDTRKGGALTLPHVSAETLQVLYAASRVCLITSRHTGGSQRTVLEAMSMNVPVLVMDDSDKTSEYINESQRMGLDGGAVAGHNNPESIRRVLDEWLKDNEPMKGREYVLSKWSEHHYANAIEEGLMKIVK